MRKLNGLETTLLEPLKGLEHSLKTEDFLCHFLDVHTKLLNILFNVDGGHFILI